MIIDDMLAELQETDKIKKRNNNITWVIVLLDCLMAISVVYLSTNRWYVYIVSGISFLIVVLTIILMHQSSKYNRLMSLIDDKIEERMYRDK